MFSFKKGNGNNNNMNTSVISGMVLNPLETLALSSVIGNLIGKSNIQ
jgi:hypothetical protein